MTVVRTTKPTKQPPPFNEGLKLHLYEDGKAEFWVGFKEYSIDELRDIHFINVSQYPPYFLSAQDEVNYYFFVDSETSKFRKIGRVILPIIRNVYPSMLANEIIGVQPMTGPESQIFTLRARYGQ